jgi:hypothetical protein
VKRLFERAKIAWQNYQYRRWQQLNPGAKFKAYFSEIVRSDLKRGKPHPSLGVRSRDKVPWLRTFGLRPDDVCVDYGCGTLRVGVHAMRYLGRGAFWGLELDQALLDRGRSLIEVELLDRKSPNLRLISPETVQEAASRRPALVISLKVLIHVHPDELHEYFHHILTIVGDSGKAIITGKWSPSQTFQFSSHCWAHSLDHLTNLVSSLGGHLSVLKEERFSNSPELIKGILEVKRAKNSNPVLGVRTTLNPLGDGQLGAMKAFEPILAWAVIEPCGALALHSIADTADRAKEFFLASGEIDEWNALEKVGVHVVAITIRRNHDNAAFLNQCL